MSVIRIYIFMTKSWSLHILDEEVILLDVSYEVEVILSLCMGLGLF